MHKDRNYHFSLISFDVYGSGFFCIQTVKSMKNIIPIINV